MKISFNQGLIIAVIFSYLLMLLGGAALKPDYSHVSQYISELNAINTPYADVISWFGFGLFGLISAITIVALAKHVPVSGMSKFGYWLLLAEPIAYLGSAFAPCDLGCPTEGSISQLLHNLLAITTLLATTLALFLLTFTPSLKLYWRLFWLGLSITFFLLFTLMIDSDFDEWKGLIQRVQEALIFSSLCIAAWRVTHK
ncbi:DUF998 domain-containing protein [Parashewanella spongiae]|uniref:DUF998 domain-containing protein n=1 Tax=Parashewanella spongiae TaxID=342950 RepID=A0A3A6UKZ9_9GAMM|nr:DUF998 domain-containing protein [Parashewanella spongiae]MCL1077527.1 DUF998 domain-containing protein [Parashewanella spongiae]RJY18267.1 DUF998 domain-containing protein [Parashewanella spongiae]